MIQFNKAKAFGDYVEVCNTLAKQQDTYSNMQLSMELIPALLERYYIAGYNAAMKEREIKIINQN